MSRFFIIGGDGKEYGPKSEEEIRDWIAQGRLNANSQTKLEGENEWRALGSRPEFSDAPKTDLPPMPGQFPAQPVSQPIGGQIPNYLPYAIAVTLCCCIPLGIPAIVYASRVDNFVRMGQLHEAKEASDKAKMWCWIGFGFGIPANIIGILLNLAPEML